MTETQAAKPLFENAKAFYDHVIASSRNGQYPAAMFRGHGLSAECRYRTEDGRKCVVGETIPDEWYRPEMESAGSSGGLYDAYPRLVDYIPPGMTRLDMAEAQRAHDRTATDGIQPDSTIRWDHALFVRRLAAVPAFAGFQAA